MELPRGPRGRRRRWRRGGFGTAELAAAERDRLSASPDRERFGELLTVEQWLDIWLESRVVLRTSTKDGYATHVRLYLKPHLGHVPLADLDRRLLNKAFAAIVKAGSPLGSSLTDASLRRIWTTLRTALNAARREGLITHNPAKDVVVPKGRRPHAVVWTERRVKKWRRTGIRPAVAVWTTMQTAQFLHSIITHRLYAAYHLIALRGLRRGEACGLRWCDIDLDNGVLMVNWQVQWIRGEAVLCPPKTPTSVRVVYLDRTTVEALRRHQHRQEAEHRARGITSSGFVFCDTGGDLLRPDYLTRTFQELVEGIGLPPVRLHDLRHGAATLALAAGADLKVVADQLGHSSIVLTADTYTSIARELGLKAAEGVAKMIMQAGSLIPGTKRVRKRESGLAHA